MSNKKKPIGFRLPDDDFQNEKQDGEVSKSEMKLQEQIEMVLAHFLPAPDAVTSDELLSTFEVQEKLSLMELEASAVYHLMKQAGFNPISIEGDLYWPVVYPMRI